MKLTFLEASEPLTKSFSLDAQGQLVKSSYPVVKDFKSHTYKDVTTIEQFYELFKEHAAKGHCLLKGELQRELAWESRAGSTNAHSETEFIIFDLDLDLGFKTPKAFMTALAATYPEYANVSYWWQHSASYMIHQPTALKVHIGLMCDPIAAPMLKLHMQDINLKMFASHLRLTKTNNALSWGVDITANQNDKLIYIAPPNVTPPELDLVKGNRSGLFVGTRSKVSTSKIAIPAAESLKNQANELINKLREQSGLPKRRKFDLKSFGQQSYLPTNEQASITGMKTDRGFVYFNLNGGDSWAYYHPENKPDFIFNFKGEPVYLTKELLPDYWSECRQNHNQLQSITGQLQGDKRVYLPIRNRREARYMCGWYDPAVGHVELSYCTREQLADFLQTYGQPVPDYYTDWEVHYDPTVSLNPYQPLDLVNRRINIFKPTKYMLNPPTKFSKKVTECPPTIKQVIESITCGDQELVKWWHNWFAYIFRIRKKTRTAITTQGVEGTGKGVLFYEIIRPLLGYENTVMKQMQELEERYTDSYETKLLAFVDEADVADNPKKKIIMANLKNQITEPTLSVRRMFSTPYEAPNFTSYIFSSNENGEPVTLTISDRRFTVFGYQPVKLMFEDKEIKQIATELEDYANFLYNWKIDENAVSKPYHSAARQLAIENSATSTDMIANQIRKGDIEALWGALPHDPNVLDIGTSLRYQTYKGIIDDIIKTGRTTLHRDEVLAIFQYNIGNIPASPAKFTRFCGHHNLHISPVSINGKTVRGYTVAVWRASSEWFAERRRELETPKLSAVKKNAMG